jgi:hypothetical protein
MVSALLKSFFCAWLNGFMQIVGMTLASNPEAAEYR